MCVCLQNRPPAVQGSQHQSHSPACMNPALMSSPWVRQKHGGRAIPNPLCLSATDSPQSVTSSSYTLLLSETSHARLKQMAVLLRSHADANIKTCFSLDSDCVTSSALLCCVRMRSLLENISIFIIHHDFSIIITSHNNELSTFFFGFFIRVQTSLAECPAFYCIVVFLQFLI